MIDNTRRTLLQGSAAAAMLAATGGLTACGSSASVGAGGPSDVTPGDGDSSRGPNSLPDPGQPAGTVNSALPFDHVVVVMMENHSFDNYLGMLPLRGQPRADGFRFDSAGVPTNSNPLDGGYQRAFHLQGTCQPGSVTQSWDSTHQQIDGNRMDGFAATSDTAMGYWDESDLPFYYSLAKTFCLGNRSYASVPGQTYPNRRFLYAGTAQGLVSTDSSTFSMPAPANGTLMDMMSKYGVSWRSYFTDLPALAIVPQTLENHPLNFTTIAQFYLDCAAGTLPAVSFVDPEFNLVSTVGQPLFDAVSSAVSQIPGLPADVVNLINGLGNKVNAQGASEENPDDVAIGEAFVSSVVQAVMASPNWSRTLLVWTYDEHGGYYDHVPPSKVPKPDDIAPVISSTDAPGAYDITGVRVPTVVVSPYARPNAVTNVMHEHTSVIATIAKKWNLPALTYRDAQANTLLDYLDLNSAPAFLTPPTLAAPAMATLGLGACQGQAPAPVIQPGP